MRTPFKAVLLLSIVSFLFLGCEQEKLLPASDDPISLETTGTTVYHERVAAIDIPEISDMISQNIGGEKGVLKMQTHNSKNIGSYTVNWDEVNLITDSLGIENYAFRLETENPDPLVFYNVIATKDAEGELLNPVIAEYVMDQAFALQWRLDPDKLRDFRGAVYYYDMAGEAYSKTGKGAVLNALRDGPPCPSITFGPTGPNNTIPNIYCWSYISYGLCETQIEYGGTGYHTAESGCHAGTGSPIMGYGVTCSTSPGGSGGGDVQKAAMTSRCGSGGGRPALPGGVPINPGSPGDADFGSFVAMLDNDIQLTLAQEEFLEEGPEVELVLKLQLLVDTFPDDPNVDDVAREVVSVMMSGNSQEKSIASLIANNDFDAVANAMNPNLGFPVYQECPNPPCVGEFDAIVVLSVEVVNNAYDGVMNLFIWWLELNHTDEKVGQLIRSFMEEMQIDIPSDVDDETLESLFKLRTRDRDFVIEPANATFTQELIDLGISVLDVVTIISPSKGGGAYFFVKNGAGKITATSFSSHLKNLKKIATTTLKGGRGYNSFSSFKNIEGNAASGNALHHIVEQGGHKSLNTLKFGNTNIHNTKNIIEIPTGSGTLHQKVTSHYQSKTAFTNGKTVREWLSDKTFEEQFEYGIKVLKDNGWDGILGVID